MARRGIAERAFSSLDLLSRRVAGEPRAGSIVVALSGGPDSTALAHIYAAWVRRTFPGCGDTSRGGCIIVNHNLRRGSGREAAVVEERARQMGLTTTVRSLDLSSSTQEAARDGRLRALHSACVDIGAKAILTGHTLNDQVETFALRAMRASGVRGLAGIPTTSVLTPSPDQGSISLRRDSIGVPLGNAIAHRTLPRAIDADTDATRSPSLSPSLSLSFSPCRLPNTRQAMARCTCTDHCLTLRRAPCLVTAPATALNS